MFGALLRMSAQLVDEPLIGRFIEAARPAFGLDMTEDTMHTRPDRYEGRLSEWLDGDLSPAEHADVERHLATCSACAARPPRIPMSMRIARRSRTR